MPSQSVRYFFAAFLSLALLANCDKSESEHVQPSENSMNQSGGLTIEMVKEGSGAEARAGDQLQVHYSGFLENGQKFDSSLDRGQPFTFTLGVGQVIRGWDQGLMGKKEGSRVILRIPPDLAYGSQGAGGVIPPNATLRFEVEIVDNLSR